MGMNENPKVPQDVRAEISWLREVMLKVNALIDGRLNNIGEFTIAASEDSTEVKNDLCRASSVVLLSPTTAEAAAEVAAGLLYAVAGNGSFTVFHDNAAETGRTFRYTLTG